MDGILNLSRDWGVVQELVVEADTQTALRGAVMAALVEHSKGADHFRVDMRPDGGNELSLQWHSSGNGNPLPFALDTVDAMTVFIVDWMTKKGQWPTETPDTDGSYHKGFRAYVGGDNGDFYDVLRVKPTYIIYGK